MADAYRTDLAYIHDDGHGHLARSAAPVLLDCLRRGGVTGGLVIDLGCGSGIGAELIAAAGYDVLGIDISEVMIARARRRVPGAEFCTGSFLSVPLPPCVAVTAVGECFNYLFDKGNTPQGLVKLFRRIHAALPPGGLLLFDVATPGRVPGSGLLRTWREGADWAVLVDWQEDRRRALLTRRITSFRKVGELFRRDHEVHRLRLLERPLLAEQLRQVGFRARTLAGYGPQKFAAGHTGFLARKAAPKGR